MSTTFSRSLNARLIAVGLVLLMAWGGIGYRLFRLQGAEAAEYVTLGEEQRLRNEVIEADRGTIFDRDRVELAVTVIAESIYVNPQEIANPEATAVAIAPLVQMNIADLMERMQRDKQKVYLVRKADPAMVELVRAAGLDGVFFEKENKRVYPAGSLAAHVLGFVRESDNEPLEGVELGFDEVLSGVDGERFVERDNSGRAIPQGRYLLTPATPGADLVLTIDREIQFAAESALADAVIASGAQSGTAVVLDPRTGGVLAMAVYPSFDPNDRSGVPLETFRNRAVTDQFEPGSTLKLVTVAAALEEGVIQPFELLTVPNEIEVNDKTYEDVGNHEPQLSVGDVVALSSNVGTILIQQRLGNEAHYRYLNAFGLGHQTDGGFAGEVAGYLRPADEWCATTCGPSTAIGYRVDVTALQMASVFGVIANDGVWVQPHIVREVVDGDGVRTPFEASQRPVVSEATAEIMQSFLQGVVDRGTGRRAAIDGYSVGGKTGTTEKFLPEEGIYSTTDRIASFIGMAPIADPQVVVAVVLDSPEGEDADGADMRFGGVSAAPVFSLIMEAALHQLGVPPDAR
ncbi:MAG: penicillin-binding protein 2 [Acidimicrobiia bacterium]|nr:penicillin-binding protein 2 [Acidimicrobiia bacterium]